MNTLLIFFAFPIAVIIISILLQKLLNNPILVAAFVFAIFLIITFAMFDETFLIATFAYTVLAFVTALLTKILSRTNENNSTTSVCNNLNNILNDNNSNNNCSRSIVQDTRGNSKNCFDYTYNRYRNF